MEKTERKKERKKERKIDLLSDCWKRKKERLIDLLSDWWKKKKERKGQEVNKSEGNIKKKKKVGERE